MPSAAAFSLAASALSRSSSFHRAIISSSARSRSAAAAARFAAASRLASSGSNSSRSRLPERISFAFAAAAREGRRLLDPGVTNFVASAGACAATGDASGAPTTFATPLSTFFASIDIVFIQTVRSGRAGKARVARWRRPRDPSRRRAPFRQKNNWARAGSPSERRAGPRSRTARTANDRANASRDANSSSSRRSPEINLVATGHRRRFSQCRARASPPASELVSLLG